MNDIDKIRAEIMRRMMEDYNGPDQDQNETAQGVCAGILAFIDGMARERGSDLEGRIVEYIRSMGGVHKLEGGVLWYTGREDNLKLLARNFYEEGKADSEKLRPIWKKAVDLYENRRLPVYDSTLRRVAIRTEEGDYYIPIEDLYTLPKED